MVFPTVMEWMWMFFASSSCSLWIRACPRNVSISIKIFDQPNMQSEMRGLHWRLNLQFPLNDCPVMFNRFTCYAHFLRTTFYVVIRSNVEENFQLSFGQVV